MAHEPNSSDLNRRVRNTVHAVELVPSKSRSEKYSCFRRFCFGTSSSSSQVPGQSLEDSCEAVGFSAYTSSTAEHRGDSPPPNVRAETALTHQSSLGTVGGVCLSDGVGYSQIKRGRLINEDSFLFECRELIDGSKVTLIGVFDGHGNEQLSHWFSVNFSDFFFRLFNIFQQCFGLPHCISYVRKLFPSEQSFKSRCSRLYALNCPDFISLSLATALALGEEVAMSLSTVDTVHGGSCATVVAQTRSGIYMAKVGDCSAAISNEGRLILKTSDHRPNCRPDEVHRVMQQGGRVYKGNSVGMAFSSLNVTRSLGDTLWRANDDWKRDNTLDAALDDELTAFSRSKGCVGISSDPEWYSCQPALTTDNSFYWDILTNSPDKTPSVKPREFSSSTSFHLVVGSDGFWETNAYSLALQRMTTPPGTPLKKEKKKSACADLLNICINSIGLTPHDDSTVIIAKIDVHIEQLVATKTAVPTARRSSDGSIDLPKGHQLDYLFNIGP